MKMSEAAQRIFHEFITSFCQKSKSLSDRDYLEVCEEISESMDALASAKRDEMTGKQVKKTSNKD